MRRAIVISYGFGQQYHSKDIFLDKLTAVKQPSSHFRTFMFYYYSNL
uniref:Uncharacterized protein n=1 Tax=Arundo donax TaxID=35708 RepID=A0A0A9HQH0_ARUDO